MIKKIQLLIWCLISTLMGIAQTAETFTNPLLESGPDPWSIYVDGYYYYTHTRQDRLVIIKTDNLAKLKDAEETVVYRPPAGTMYSAELWAPEIHYIDGVWYMYYAADDGDNNNHRMYVIRNTKDPILDEWEFLGPIKGMSDHWAIDASIFKMGKQLYVVWSGWEGPVNGRQDIYIQKMKNPYTAKGSRVMLSKPEFDWETNGVVDGQGVHVNEGPQFLAYGERVFLIYSASGCWTDEYNLGMLYADKNSDLMNPESWTKSDQPVFKKSLENSVYAPGHNSFFKSPDGTEDWILYHANDEAGWGCGPRRSPRAQKFSWDEEGFPVFGKPMPRDIPVEIPSEKTIE